jgi:transcription initiation factor TFIIIB Brf1 subunit/transcription initiation factor TFIIB
MSKKRAIKINPTYQEDTSMDVTTDGPLFDFNSFDSELLEFFDDQTVYNAIKSKIIDTPGIEECVHPNSFQEDGIFICKECGCEVEKLDFQPEWRYYGASDNRLSKDPSRCHRTKENTKGGIEKVFQDAKLVHIPLAIRKTTEDKYKTIVGNNTVRGSGRKSIVAACLMYTLREEGDIRTCDEIRGLFGLTRQEISSGLSEYHAIFKEDRTKSIKPADLIRRILHLTKIGISHYKPILRIAKSLDKVDPILNRSSPQSVASAIVYLYLCLTPELKEEMGYTKTKFAQKVSLSDITITKLVKRVTELLGEEVDI